MKNKGRACAAFLSLLALLPPQATAMYKANTETGADALDFIENRRRMERENMLTDEQQKLLADTQEMAENLRHPVDPTKASPMAFEGDDLTYNEETGEFVAKGKVHAIQLDGHQFDAPEGPVQGNLKTNDIEIPGKAHMLQLTPGQSRVILDGVNTVYNYRTKLGTMGEARGKVDHQYVTGKRFEFYPDRIVVYDGTSTKCGAKNPDYHLSARKMTIYPNDKIVMEHVGTWLKNACLFTKKSHVVDLKKNENDLELPRVGYSKDDGVWISQDFSLPLFKNVEGQAHLYANTKEGLKSNGQIGWYNRNAGYELRYGSYEDSGDKWIKKEPSFVYKYARPLGKTHLNYSFDVEWGRWHKKANDITSTHRYYGLTLSRDPIFLGGGWYISPSITYSITRESYDHSKVDGLSWSLSTVKEFDSRWAMYATYAYSKNSKETSLFDYGVNDFTRQFRAGVSYQASDRDRFVVGTSYNMDDGAFKFNKLDCYWFHDMHCSQFVIQYRHYRDEKDSVKFGWQFTPW